MPDLFDVAQHFDDIAVLDGYNLAHLYYGQFSTFLEASPDGSTSQRRTLSLAPGLALPARKVVNMLGEPWLVGYGNVDGIFGQVIRQSFWMKKATDTFSILTPGEAALGSAGVSAYAHKEYLKDTVNNLTDSEYDPFWDIFFGTSESVSKGTFLRAGSTLFRVRSIHVGKEGMIDAASDELDAGASVTAQFTELGAYVPASDSYTAGDVATTGILLDRYKAYEFRTEADEKTAPGDMTLVVAASAVTPKIGRKVSIAGTPWAVQGLTAEQDSWSLHLRRA
jgi:hypothetical protein